MNQVKKSILRVHKINPFLEQINFEQDNILKQRDPFDIVRPFENVYYFYRGKYTPEKQIDHEDLQENISKVTLYNEGNFYDPSPTIIYERESILDLLKGGEISDKSCKILLYVITKVGKNSTAVKLNKTLLAEDLKIVGNDYNKYIGELVTAGFIAKKDDSEYWINPNYFFHGRRYKYFIGKPLYKDFGLENYDLSSDTIKPEEVTLGREIITRGSAYRLAYDEVEKKTTPKYLCELQHMNEDITANDKLEYFGVEKGINLDIKEKVDNVRNKWSKVVNRKKPRTK